MTARCRRQPPDAGSPAKASPAQRPRIARQPARTAPQSHAGLVVEHPHPQHAGFRNVHHQPSGVDTCAMPCWFKSGANRWSRCGAHPPIPLERARSVPHATRRRSFRRTALPLSSHAASPLSFTPCIASPLTRLVCRDHTVGSPRTFDAIFEKPRTLLLRIW